MTKNEQTRLSKFLSKYLRHEPEYLGLTLEPGGWVKVDDLIKGSKDKGMELDWDKLMYIVDNCDKKRFTIDGDKIRANQGHSTEVDLQLVPVIPPDILFHGTVVKFIPNIIDRKEGLNKMNRHHVHLSKDLFTATKVGLRRGAPIVLKVESGLMYKDGFEFYVSENGVWLTDHVPIIYISKEF